MRFLASIRLSHFIVPLLLILGGMVVGSRVRMSPFFTSLFTVLSTLLILLGGALCVVYGRLRQLFLLLSVYLAYFLLDAQMERFRELHQADEETALVFHLCSVLLPLLYGAYGWWEERAHLLQDLVARSALGVAVVAVFAALASRFPQGMLDFLGTVYWPLLYGQDMALVQLAYFTFFIAAVLLVARYLRQPRPLHGAQLVALSGLLWMLPRVFIAPYALGVMASAVMLALTVAIAHEAYQMAFRDELTGLPGRRALNERLQRLGRSYVIAMADVDHFKKFNDTHGHDVGDQVLRMVAAQLRRIGGGGRAYRYGGEEFTLLFPGKTLEQCLPHLERVRQSIEHYTLHLRDRQQRPANARVGRSQRGSGSSGNVSVTVSLGVAERSEAQRSPEEVIKAADRALYAAKNAGRNRISVQGQSRRGAVRVKSREDA